MNHNQDPHTELVNHPTISTGDRQPDEAMRYINVHEIESRFADYLGDWIIPWDLSAPDDGRWGQCCPTGRTDTNDDLNCP